MCQTTEGARPDSPFRVEGGEHHDGCDERIHQVLYKKGHASTATALSHFIAHHLRGREIVSIVPDPVLKKRMHILDGDPEEYFALVIVTKTRPFKHNSDM